MLCGAITHAALIVMHRMMPVCLFSPCSLDGNRSLDRVVTRGKQFKEKAFCFGPSSCFVGIFGAKFKKEM
jgi:hypothetical protein